MRRFQILLLVLLLLPAMLAARRHRRRIVPMSRLVFTHVTIIDATGVPPKANMTVVITANRISGLGPDGTVAIPRDSRIIDARDKFMIPGLWDMHTRCDNPRWWPPDSTEKSKVMWLPLFIAQGVTGIRDMGGDLKLLLDWREQIRVGKMTGPHIEAGGLLFDASNAATSASLATTTPEEAREAVRRLKAEDADFITVNSQLPREVYFAVADEARALHIPFAGQAPDTVTPAEASDAGQASEEGLFRILEFCSNREAVAQKLRVLQAEGASLARERAAQIDTMLSTYDAAKADALFQRFVKNGTWIDPTLSRWKANVDVGESEPAKRDRPSFLPKDIREEVTSKSSDRVHDPSPQLMEAETRLLRKYEEMIGVMRRSGVSFLVGSGMSGQPRMLPGWGVHDEMALLVKSGLTPMEALQAATLNAARFLGHKDWLGTVEKGKVADLVLLNANPLDDIHNTTKIAGVVFNGKYLPEQELGEMLAHIKSEQNKP